MSGLNPNATVFTISQHKISLYTKPQPKNANNSELVRKQTSVKVKEKLNMIINLLNEEIEW